MVDVLVVGEVDVAISTPPVDNVPSMIALGSIKPTFTATVPHK
jgi:hypothetical protein